MLQNVVFAVPVNIDVNKYQVRNVKEMEYFLNFTKC
jgi:hypothetical protein